MLWTKERKFASKDVASTPTQFFKEKVMINLFKMFRKDAKDTSVEAAKSIMFALPNIEGAVYEYAAMRGSKGFTDDQMNEHFETHKSTYRTRRSSLVEKGLIEDSGMRMKGPNGRNMTVWRIV